MKFNTSNNPSEGIAHSSVSPPKPRTWRSQFSESSKTTNMAVSFYRAKLYIRRKPLFMFGENQMKATEYAMGQM
jgi:hypothetical protein